MLHLERVGARVIVCAVVGVVVALTTVLLW